MTVQAGNFAMFENLATEAGYSIGSSSTRWGASWGICTVLSRNHQNKLGFDEKSCCCSTRECCRLHV